MYNPQGGVWNPQGGASNNLQASPSSGLRVQPAPTNSAQLLQPTTAPGLGQRLVGPSARRANATLTPAGGQAGGAAAGPSAADIAAQQQAQEVAALRNDIIGRRQRANAIFDALTGAVNSLAQEKRGQLEAQFQQNSQRAQEDFITKGDELNSVYAARGLGDSSYRVNAANLASRDYQRTFQDLVGGRDAGLAKVGAEAVGTQAQIAADRNSVNSRNLNEINDPNALRELRNQTEDRVNKADVQSAQFGTDAGFRGRLDQIAPYAGINDALKSALTGLIQSATPKPVKDKLAGALISNYAPGDAQIWQQFYDEQSRKVESPSNAG